LRNSASRAWRRPPTDAEIAQLQALVAGVQNSADEPGDALAKTTQGIKIALQAALLSPHFVYRPELDPDPNAGPLSFQLAARVDFGAEVKQQLLEQRSEARRMHVIAELLENAVRTIVLEQEVLERASQNGRVSID